MHVQGSRFIKRVSAAKQLNAIYRYYGTQVSDAIPHPTQQVQAYISKSRDPYLNLSIEHHLFEKAPPGSKLLFLYTNRPCVVIGRNQNPWLEANLRLLKDPRALTDGSTTDTQQTRPPTVLTSPIALVRRRSGGGAVFHDTGNVNWSVGVDSASFARDRHAEMVQRALARAGVAEAHVNARHDVVVRRGGAPLKVSGSAFKLARGRAMHHGTALLGSPHLASIARLLRSPAAPFIAAKGVESVRSPVANVGVANDVFERAVLEEFAEMYSVEGALEPRVVGEEMAEVNGVAKGMAELKSLEWLFLQTPAFTFTFEMTTGKGLRLPVSLEVRHGAIEKCYSKTQAEELSSSLIGKKLHEIQGAGDWRSLLAEDPFLDEDGDFAQVSSELIEPTRIDQFLSRMISH